MKTSQTPKSAEYYLGLRYTKAVRPLSAEEGGGYVATIPLLGRKTFVAVGETESEACAALDELREMIIPELVNQGVALPEPQDEEEVQERFSGHIMLRVPPGLHTDLANYARRQKVSVNKLATQFLSQGLTGRMLQDEVKQLKQHVQDALSERLQQQQTGITSLTGR